MATYIYDAWIKATTGKFKHHEQVAVLIGHKCPVVIRSTTTIVVISLLVQRYIRNLTTTIQCRDNLSPEDTRNVLCSVVDRGVLRKRDVAIAIDWCPTDAGISGTNTSSATRLICPRRKYITAGVA